MRQKKNLLRAVKPQKVWVVELLCSTRCAGRPALGAVLTASSDHEGQVTYSPFDWEGVYIRLKGISTRTIFHHRKSPFALFAPVCSVSSVATHVHLGRAMPEKDFPRNRTVAVNAVEDLRPGSMNF